MTLVYYFLKRFFKYFLLINTSITFLFNFIEFFEKLVRIKHATTGTIIHFIILNTVPSFFDNLALSSWLTTCLLLKEFYQQNEIDTFRILNINSKKLFNLFFLAGSILAIFSFIGKEKFVLNLINESNEFKLEKLKNQDIKKIFDRWIIIIPQKDPNKLEINNLSNIYCYFSFLDTEKNIGTDFLLFYVNQNFEIEKTIVAKEFFINLNEKSILIKKALQLDIKDNNQEDLINLNLNIPSFFSQLQFNNNIPSLYTILQSLITSKNILPSNIWYDLLFQLLKRILAHLQLIIYPLLTFCLFLLIPYESKLRWILILLPYPLITILTSWLVIFPYFLFILVIFIIKKRLEKTF